MSTTTETVTTVPVGVSTVIAASNANRVGLYVQPRGSSRVKIRPAALASTAINDGMVLAAGVGMDILRGHPLSGGTVPAYTGKWTCWNYGPVGVDIYTQEVVT